MIAANINYVDTNLDFEKLSVFTSSFLERQLTDEELRAIFLLANYKITTNQMIRIYDEIESKGDEVARYISL